MTAFTLSANTNIDALASKTGGDTYATAGFKLTIDQDSRTGANQTTSTTLGSMTITAATGGEIHIDGTAIWMIPFTGGSGTVPAWNTVITNSTGSGKLIGVHSSLTAASTATGATMPTSGFIRVKQKTGAYASGALTGITASASDAGKVGWLEIVGDEAATVNANRLGVFRVTGAWFELGTTSGTSNQTLQIPNNGLLRYVAGVFIAREAPRAATYTWSANVVTVTLSAHAFTVGTQVELAFSTGAATPNTTYTVASVVDASTFTVALSGSGTGGNCTVEFLEFYCNGGTTTTTGTEAARGKVVWIDANGLVRIGNSGAATNGYTPDSGLRVVVPNIFLENCTTANRTANAIPHATLATRYDFTTTGGGVLEINKCNMAWYLSPTQAYSVNLSNCCFIDSIRLERTSVPMNISKIGVGNKPTTAQNTFALNMTYCYAGGTFTDCVWARESMTSSGFHTIQATDNSDFNFVRNTFRANAIRGNSTTYSLDLTRFDRSSFTNTVIIQGAINILSSSGITITDTIFCDAVSGETSSTYTGYVVRFTTTTRDCVFSGLTFPVANTHPYTQLVFISNTDNIKIRNIGTRAAPLDLGTVNACGQVYSVVASVNVKIQRIYCKNNRTGVATHANTAKDIIEENVVGDYADATDVLGCLNTTRKGFGGTGSYSAQVAIYGSHWFDSFTSTTAGRINIVMNEPSAETAAQVALTGGAGFTGSGSLSMPTIGQTATFEMPEYIIGHTGFQDAALVMGIGTVGDYRFEYSIDKNDGNGWSTMTTSSYTAANLGTALNGITGIDASKGIKLKLKITTTTTNTAALTYVYVLTNSSTTAQDYQYPLDVATLTISGLPVGSEVRCYTGAKGASAVEIGGTETTTASTFSFTHVSGGVSGFIHIIHPDYEIKEIDLTYPSSDYELLVQMAADKWYSNPA